MGAVLRFRNRLPYPMRLAVMPSDLGKLFSETVQGHAMQMLLATQE